MDHNDSCSMAAPPSFENPFAYEGEPVFCYCGRKAPQWICWKSNSNFGRRFFDCERFKYGGCNFFQWHDGPIDHPGARFLIMELRNAYKASAAENKKLKQDLISLRQQTGEVSSNNDIYYEALASRIESDHFSHLLREAQTARATEARKKKTFKLLLIGTWIFLFIMWHIVSGKSHNHGGYLGLP